MDAVCLERGTTGSSIYRMPSTTTNMLDSPDYVESFGEDDMGTLILVNRDDSAVGSVSFADRVASLSTKSSQAIHRTASLFVFDASKKVLESDTGRILLSASNEPFDKESAPTTVRA